MFLTTKNSLIRKQILTSHVGLVVYIELTLIQNLEFSIIVLELKKIFTFLFWAVFTFFSHYSAKLFLSNSEYLTKNVIILTCLQMTCGSLIFLKSLTSGEVINVILVEFLIFILSLDPRDKQPCIFFPLYLPSPWVTMNRMEILDGD